MFELVCLYNFADHGSSHPESFCKKGFVKIFGKFAGKHLCWSLFFLKKWLSEEKKKGSRIGVFFWVLQNLSEHWFWTMLTNACYDDQVLRQSSTMFYVFPLRFKLILLIILKLTISWNFVMILQTFDSGFFPT